MRYVPIELQNICSTPFSLWVLLLYNEIQAFTTLAMNCIKENLAEKLSKCRSHAATLDKENMKVVSLIKQTRRDTKTLQTQELSM